MKKSILTILFIMFLSASYAQENYSRDVILQEKKSNTIVLKSTGEHEKKKEAVLMAVKSAFDTYMFAGIAGINEDKPLIPEENLRLDNETYFKRLFDEGRYSVFCKNIVELEKPKKNKFTNKYSSTVLVEIYCDALYKDLLKSKVIEPKASDISMKETKKMMVMPSIIVVPYKNAGSTYKEILANDFDKRMAVAKVQDEFRSKGIQTVDIEAKLDATLRSLEFESDASDSFDSQLIKNSGADVYVTVDLVKDSRTGGSRVALTLKAYDTATGRVLASKQSSSERYNTSAFDKLCVFAVQSVSAAFLKDVSESFANNLAEGTSVTLRISIDGTSYKTLDDEVGGTDFGISDIVRAWLRKNAIDGMFHMQGKTDTVMILDEVKVPVKNEDGVLQDSGDFALRLTRFMKKKGISASNRVDGSTIYITVTD